MERLVSYHCAQRRYRSAMVFQAALFSLLRRKLAIWPHSIACLRSSSDGFMGLPVHGFFREFSAEQKVPVLVAIICLCVRSGRTTVSKKSDLLRRLVGGRRCRCGSRRRDTAGTRSLLPQFPSRESVGIALRNRKQRKKPTAENHRRKGKYPKSLVVDYVLPVIVEPVIQMSDGHG
jgi:hypothetical protein